MQHIKRVLADIASWPFFAGAGILIYIGFVRSQDVNWLLILLGVAVFVVGSRVQKSLKNKNFVQFTHPTEKVRVYESSSEEVVQIIVGTIRKAMAQKG